jgi:hypothetical protein
MEDAPTTHSILDIGEKKENRRQARLYSKILKLIVEKRYGTSEQKRTAAVCLWRIPNGDVQQ